MEKLTNMENLRITGDISIEPVTSTRKNGYHYLLMGPTGAGKSSFIEALAGKSQNLSIAKDQLAGCTQTVTVYHVVGLPRISSGEEYPVYLIDTPGFSDSKISEMEIMDMVREWLKGHGLEIIDGIFFLMPITETRFPGSRRRTIEMLRTFLQPSNDLTAILFVTTMWDTLHSERVRKRAESNYEQLKNDILKDFLDTERGLIKFLNTKSSAIEIMDSTQYWSRAFAVLPDEIPPPLYVDLFERIQSCLQVQAYIESDLSQPQTQANPLLKFVLEQYLSDNNATLRKFISQFVGLGDPPAGFEESNQHLLDVIKSAGLMPAVIPRKPIRPVSPASDNNNPVEEPEESVTDSDDSTSEPVVPAQPAPAEEPEPEESVSDDSTSEPVLPAQPALAEELQMDVKPPGDSNTVPQIKRTRIIALRGLLRRLLRAARYRGSKWFKLKG